MYPTSTLVNAIPTERGGVGEYLESLFKGKQIAHVLQRNFAHTTLKKFANLYFSLILNLHVKIGWVRFRTINIFPHFMLNNWISK